MGRCRTPGECPGLALDRAADDVCLQGEEVRQRVRDQGQGGEEPGEEVPGGAVGDGSEEQCRHGDRRRDEGCSLLPGEAAEPPKKGKLLLREAAAVPV